LCIANIKVILNLYARRVAQLCRIVSLFQQHQTGPTPRISSRLPPFLGWLTLSGLVAHFAPEWWLTMVRISHALETGCSILYSEDMQHGLLVERQLKIVNPFIY
jgi:hypothetical protein